MKLASRLLIGAAALLFSVGTAAAMSAVAVVDLNMRSGPGTGYPVVAVIPQGEPVDATNCNAGWCQVAYGGAMGWASEAYLNLTGDNYSYGYGGPYYTWPYYGGYIGSYWYGNWPYYGNYYYNRPYYNRPYYNRPYYNRPGYYRPGYAYNRPGYYNRPGRYGGAYLGPRVGGGLYGGGARVGGGFHGGGGALRGGGGARMGGGFHGGGGGFHGGGGARRH
jgi:hypothetical protein